MYNALILHNVLKFYAYLVRKWLNVEKSWDRDREVYMNTCMR